MSTPHADYGDLTDRFTVQRTRGTTAQHGSFTGLNGELTVNTDTKVVHVHDGDTEGGFPLARQFDHNAKEYGAVGDGSADDTDALQDTLDAAGSGGIARIPAGTYKITDVLTVPANCRVIGAGIGKTTINQATSATGTFLVDSVSNASIEDISLNGQSASVIAVRCSGSSDVSYFRLRNIDIASLGTAGVGVDIQSSAAKFVGFSTLENVTVSGGGASAWGTKIGIRLGLDSGANLHVVRTSIRGCRVWRCHTGILLDNCDTTMVHSLSMDDIDGNGLDFNKASGCNFNWVSFENGTFGKYIAFGSNSADNHVDGFLANASTSEVTDAGTRNSWQGSDGSGGLKNRVAGPQAFGGTVNDATIRNGAIETPRVDTPADSSESPAWNLGGTWNSGGPGGSSITHDHLFPFTTNRPATYLAFAQSISTAGSPTEATRMTLVIEHVSGTFIPYDIVNQTSGGASVNFSFARTGDDVNFTVASLTNDGTAPNVSRNLIKIC